MKATQTTHLRMWKKDALAIIKTIVREKVAATSLGKASHEPSGLFHARPLQEAFRILTNFDTFTCVTRLTTK